ncbi:MAG: hypothetical protein R3E39_15615 [Anaerolineae bacterium]
MSTPISQIIKLARVEDLFSLPPLDPFDARYPARSGMEQIATFVRANAIRDGLHITFVLPAATPRQDMLKVEIQSAIARYCDDIINSTRIELTERRQTTYHNLAVGTLILAVSLALGAVVSNAEFISGGIRNLLSNTISILGTVAVWTPTDALLFGQRPLRKTIKIYTAIRNMSFDIHCTDMD